MYVCSIKKQEYMSFSDLFDSGFKKRNEDHFASIVRIAMDDGIISDEEKAFIDRLARNLGLSDENYKQILKDYQTHPINPPTSYDRRLERLPAIEVARAETQIPVARDLSHQLGLDKISADQPCDIGSAGNRIRVQKTHFEIDAPRDAVEAPSVLAPVALMPDAEGRALVARIHAGSPRNGWRLNFSLLGSLSIKIGRTQDQTRAQRGVG